jgi:hypothetical protein
MLCPPFDRRFGPNCEILAVSKCGLLYPLSGRYGDVPSLRLRAMKRLMHSSILRLHSSLLSNEIGVADSGRA